MQGTRKDIFSPLLLQMLHSIFLFSAVRRRHVQLEPLLKPLLTRALHNLLSSLPLQHFLSDISICFYISLLPRQHFLSAFSICFYISLLPRQHFLSDISICFYISLLPLQNFISNISICLYFFIASSAFLISIQHSFFYTSLLPLQHFLSAFVFIFLYCLFSISCQHSAFVFIFLYCLVSNFQPANTCFYIPSLPVCISVSIIDQILEHNCTIFLCSLDVRNIVQGGDPLYAGFFSTQGSGGYT